MELLQLDDFYRKASLGKEYFELYNDNNKWANALHKNGNIMENYVLENISINGLIRWYLQKCIPFDIDYNFEQLINFIENPQIITYSEVKYIRQFGHYYGIKNKFIDNINFDRYALKSQYLFFIFKSYSKINIKINLDKYCTAPFGKYICDIISEDISSDIFKKYLIEVYNELIKNQLFFINKTFYKSFLNKNEKIKKWGVIYHKFKIVLEKIACVKHKDIYKVDIFVESVQQYIYTLIIKYVENFIIKNNSDIYIKKEEKLNNDILLLPYPDDKLKEEFDFLCNIFN
jgi:hypothetical protein